MHKKCKLFCNTGIKTEGSPERGFFCRSRLFPHLERQKKILRANLFRVIQIMIKNQNSFRENRGLRDGGGRRKTPTKISCAKRRKTVEQSEKNNETESRKSDFPRKTRKLYQETGEYLTSFACTATLPLEKPLQVTRVIILSSSVNLNVPRDGISFNPCR